MNLFDIFLIGIIFLSCLSGLRTGFARVVVHLFATFAGLLTAFWCYGIAAARLQPYLHQPIAADVAGFCLIFFGVMVLGSVLGFLLARVFQWIGLGWLDHLLGGAAGLIRGALLAAVAVAVTLAFTPMPPPSFITDSRVIPYATRLSGLLAELAPKQIRDGFLQQTDKLKQMWMESPSKEQRII
jgi:membrane protein required for colicin V production